MATKLDGIYRASMLTKHHEACVRIAIPDTNGLIFTAGNDVLFIKAYVQDAGAVMLETLDWQPSLYVPDEARMIRRASHHDSVIVLQTQNGRGMA